MIERLEESDASSVEEFSLSLGEKVAHVRAARQTREHTCHWPGCKQQVPPARWGCPRHWFMLPKPIRDLIWRTYRPGQEETLTPSAAYLEATQKAEDWIREFGLSREGTRRPAARGASR